ncbi:MAG TPA: hypothetical protein VFV94_15315 [Polyangiaceae bacterium]|nr:hypothetical protein [Polyangiaceae bacterium]
MSRLALTLWSALVAAAIPACGGQTQPASSSPAPAEATPATAASSEPLPAASSDATAASATPSAAPAPPAPPPPPPISELCEKMCDAQTAKCSPEKVKGCKQNYCSRYGGAPEVCEPAVRAALACTEQNPEFSVCSNVISISCAKPFRAAEKCIATGVAPEDLGPPKEIPDGWTRYESKEEGFSVAMPPNVEMRSEGGLKIWSAKSGNATYEITLGPPPPEEKKFDQKAFVRIGTKMLGKCGPKMKLFAMVEKPESTLIHYRTVCPDKTQKRGEIFVQGKDYFVLTATWGEGPNPDAEAFAFTFVRKK